MAKLQEGADGLSQFKEGCGQVASAQEMGKLGEQLKDAEKQVAEGTGQEGGMAGSPSTSEEPNLNAPGGPGPGGGSTNEAQPTGPEGQEGYEDTYRKETPRTGEYEALYAPKDTPHGTKDTRVRGQMRDEGETETVDVRSAPRRSDAYVPYYDVIGEYKPAVEDALSNEEIPRGYRDQVREYFESLGTGSGSERGQEP